MKQYQKTGKIFLQFVLYAFIALTVAAFVMGIATFEEKMTLVQKKSILILNGIQIYFFVCAILFFYIKVIGKCQKRTRIFFRMLIILMIFLLQIICLTGLGKITLTSDSFKVTDMAADMANNTGGIMNNLVSDEVTLGYFARYENNHFFTILLYYYFCIIKFFGGNQFIEAARILNVIMLDLGIVLSYLAARKMWGNKRADVVLLLAALSPTTYLWLFWSYTNTFSIPFVMGILLLYLYAKDTKSTQGMAVYGIGMGILSIIGYFVRPTTIIPIIAVFLMQILFRAKMDKENLKKTLIWMVSFGCAIILGTGVITVVRKSHLMDPFGQGRFPITHWLMMGVSDEGGFNVNDLNYTLQFDTVEEKNQADIIKIKQRLKEKGPVGLAIHAVKKLGRTYGNGVDNFTQQAAYAEKQTKLYLYVYGEKNDWLIIYCNSFRLVTLSLTVIMAVEMLKRKRVKDIFAYALTLFGSMLFFIIWEANKKYGISFQYVMLLLAGGAVITLNEREILLDKWSAHKDTKMQFIRRGKVVLCGMGIVVTMLSLLSGYRAYTMEQYQYSKKIVNLEPQPKNIKNVIKEGKVLEQGFAANQPFDELIVFTEPHNKYSTKKKAKYKISIFNGDGERLVSKIVGRKTKMKDKTLKIKFSKIYPKKEETEQFFIRIEGYKGEEDFLAFRMLSYQEEDKYESGILKINSQDVKGDLAFRIINKCEETYLSKKVYFVAGGVVLLLEMIFLLGTIKAAKFNWKSIGK